MDPVFVLISAVFTASLLGSLHCAGMCGAFMLFAVGADRQPTVGQRVMLHAAYHGGRLVTYSILGAIAGSVGAALDFGGSMVGVQRIAAAVAGALMIGFGLVTIARLRGAKLRLPGAPTPARKFVERVQARAMRLPAGTRALTIGLMTTLLPCGWLYAFVITSGGTGSPWLGALTMAVFWAGTLPVMVSLGVGLQAVMGRFAKHLPMVTSLAVVAVGVFMVFGRVTAPVMTRESIGVVAPTSLEDAAGAVPAAGDVHCPLCDGAADG